MSKKLEAQSNNEKQQTVNTPKLVTVTADKPNELVDTDNQNVEYTSTLTQQLTDKCQIEVKLADSSESSDNPAGSEHRVVELLNLIYTIATTGIKGVRTLQSTSDSSLKETVEEETNFGIERMKSHSSDVDSSSFPAEKELEQNSSWDGELDSKNNWKRNKACEQDFDSFEKEWKKITDFRVVREQEGDGFEMPNEYSLASCVAEDFHMDPEIVTSSSSQFKNLCVVYSQKQQQGGVAYFKDKERYVYYLVTKRVSWGKPTYQTMWNSLHHLRLRMEEHGVKKLAVTRLGCGFNCLEWVKVKAMIETIFEGMMDVEIVVFNLDQCRPMEDMMFDGCNVNYEIKRLVKMANKDTILIYLGYEDNTETDSMKSIDEKHPFLDSSYRITARKIGNAVVTKFEEYALYGFIVRKRKNDPLDFVAFETCAQQLYRDNDERKNPYFHVAIEAFKDPQDVLVMVKLINLLRYALRNVDFKICSPENMMVSLDI